MPYTSGSNLTLVTGGSGGFGPFIVISAGLKCVISSTTLLTGIVGLGYLLGTLLAGIDPARQVRIGVNLGQHRARAGIAVALGPKEFLHGAICLVYSQIRVSRGARIRVGDRNSAEGRPADYVRRVPSGQSGSKSGLYS